MTMKYVVSFILITNIFLTSCSDSPTTSILPKYNILKVDSTNRQLDFDVKLYEKLDTQKLVSIARFLRTTRNWQEKLVCNFYLEPYTPGRYWASVSYLPSCDDCSEYFDEDGKLAVISMVGETANEETATLNLPIETPTGYQVLVTYYDATWKCKTSIFINSKNSQIGLVLQKFKDDSLPARRIIHRVSGNSDGKFRYIDDGDTMYYVISKTTNTVETTNSNGESIDKNKIK